MANATKIREVLDHIVDHPEQWYQSLYAVQMACGTAYCAAGLAVILNGHKVQWYTDVVEVGASTSEVVFKDDAPYSIRDIHELAQEELELTEEEADLFFDQDNSLDNLWDLANQFTNDAVGYRV